MEHDAEDVMSRIAQQILRASPDKALPTAGNSFSGGIVAWAARGSSIPVKPEYKLSELLAYRDRVFVETAFEVVLKRKASESERRDYLACLRDGSMNRVELLGRLRWSEEGVARGTHIDGLLVPYTLRRWSKKPWGRVIAWLRAMARVDILLDRADEESAAISRDVTEANEEASSALGHLHERLNRLDATVNELRGLQDALVATTNFEPELQDIRTQLEQLAPLRAQCDNAMGALAATTAGHAEQLTALQRDLIRQREAAEELALSQKGSEQVLHARMDALEHHTTAHGAALEHARQRESAANEASRALDPLYVAFEAAFRGPEPIIRERFSPYIELMHSAGAGTAERPIFDIGTGSGEWLQLAKDHKLIGAGVDSNRLFVELCRGRGLVVDEDDGIEALSRLADNSRGAITAMHVAEHLPFEVLVRLIDESRRVLAPGGVLILETPNPENLRVGSHTFYLDPTHRNPLPPEMLRWIVSARGFMEVEIQRLTAAREMPVPPQVAADAVGAAAINTFVSMLSAAPDYAIVGRKR